MSMVMAAVMLAEAVPSAAPVSATAQPKTTLQQDFDAATALTFAGKDWAAALAAWEALERRAKSPRVLGVVRARKSFVLMRLSRVEEAASAASLALETMPAGDSSLTEDRYYATLNVAYGRQRALDYAGAVDAFRAAVGLAPDSTAKLSALQALVETGIFVDTTAAEADLQSLIALAASQQLDEKTRATIKTLEAELRLNQGRFDEARKAAGSAVGLLGGLSNSVSLAGVRARSDYAIAALLLGDKDKAREYMAYTGAGRFPKGRLDVGDDNYVPTCGGDLGLKPNDSAVIAFNLDTNGNVVWTQPVYAAGGGAAGLAFARAVRDWSFKPSNIADIPAFFRYEIRIEMRCSTTFIRPQASEMATQALVSWFKAQGLTADVDTKVSSAQALIQAQKKLSALEGSGETEGPRVAFAAFNVTSSPLMGWSEGRALAIKARAALNSLPVPPLALLAIDLRIWRPADWAKRSAYIAAMQKAVSEAPYSGDPQARALLRLLIADAARAQQSAVAATALNAVLADTQLGANDPLRVGAAVRLASLHQASGRIKDAESAFAAAGIAPDQCALLDAPPKQRYTSGQFPNEALFYGFEGWTKVEFDIDANGKVLNQRAIISYPPFVFSEGSVDFMAKTVFEKTYRPDGGLGCGGQWQRLLFSIPK